MTIKELVIRIITDETKIDKFNLIDEVRSITGCDLPKVSHIIYDLLQEKIIIQNNNFEIMLGE